MKIALATTLAAAGLAVSFSVAYARDKSPGEAVITGPEVYAKPSDARFLSGNTGGRDHLVGKSDNGIQAREFRAVQKGGHWLRKGDED